MGDRWGTEERPLVYPWGTSEEGTLVESVERIRGGSLVNPGRTLGVSAGKLLKR
jgi:hypothetical protein